MNQGQDEPATRKSAVRYRNAHHAWRHWNRERRKAVKYQRMSQPSRWEWQMERNTFVWKAASWLRAEGREYQKLGIHPVVEAGRQMSGWVFPWGSNKSVLFTITSSGRSCHSLANQQGACQRPAATKQAHAQQLVVLQAPWAAENEQQPCMMPVPSADGCRQVTSAESENMTYSYYLSGIGKYILWFAPKGNIVFFGGEAYSGVLSWCNSHCGGPDKGEDAA